MPEGTIAVVLEADVLDEAYGMGFKRFNQSDSIVGEGALEAVSHFKETAEWANNAAPALRALSGYTDSGPGTYTVERDAVVVPVGDGDDLPMNGRVYHVSYVFDRVVEAFDNGAYDALSPDNKYGDNDDVQIT